MALPCIIISEPLPFVKRFLGWCGDGAEPGAPSRREGAERTEKTQSRATPGEIRKTARSRKIRLRAAVLTGNCSRFCPVGRGSTGTTPARGAASADGDVQAEGERLQNLIDELIDRLGGERLVPRREEGKTERHRLLTGTDLLGAVNVEQLDLTHLLAGGADGIGDLAAGDRLVGDEREVTRDGREFRNGGKTDELREGGGELFKVDLSDKHIAGELCRFGDLIGQAPEVTDLLLGEQDFRRLARMEERLGAALIGQADAEGIGDRLGGALRREEALLLAVQPEAERLLLGRECSCLARDKAVCKLKEPAARVPALLVGRRRRGAGGRGRRGRRTSN